MVTESDRIRADIEATRSDLAADMSTLADRTSPKRIAVRRWDTMKGRVASVRDRVMGSATETTGAMSEKASGMASAVREAPDTVARQTQGNPLAAGLVAFGAGLLAAAALPASEPERRLGSQLSDRADMVIAPVRSAAQDVGQDVEASATSAAQEVGQAAKDAASRTAGQASQWGREAKEQVQQ